MTHPRPLTHCIPTKHFRTHSPPASERKHILSRRLAPSAQPPSLPLSPTLPLPLLIPIIGEREVKQFPLPGELPYVKENEYYWATLTFPPLAFSTFSVLSSNFIVVYYKRMMWKILQRQRPDTHANK